MKTEVLDREKPAASERPTAQKVANNVGPRVRGVIKIIFEKLGSVKKLQEAAHKQGYSKAEFSEACKRLEEMTFDLESGELKVSAPAEAAATGTKSSRRAFDPYAAGERLVKDLQAAEGGAWTGQELQERFNLTPAVLHRRRKEHRILSWRDAQHEFHYPQWQFTPTGALLPGVQEVLQTFRSNDEWRLMSYFLGQRRQLGGRRPLDLLRDGEKEKVLAHAKIHVEENTW